MKIEDIDVKLPEEQPTEVTSAGEESSDVISAKTTELKKDAPEIQTENLPATDTPSEIPDVVNVPLENSEETTMEVSVPEETVPVANEATEPRESCMHETPPSEQDIPEAEKVIEEEVRKKLPQSDNGSPIGITQEQLTAILNESNEAVLMSVTALGGQLRDINARVSSLRKLADLHEGIENDLNNQINSYKDNFYRRIVNPILMEIFDVQEYMNSDIPTSSEETAKALQEYVDMLTKVLKHYGVTVETVSVGDTYDVKLHKPVKAIPTTDTSLDKKIAKTRKTLIYFIDGQLVERAPVQVYQYTNAVASSSENV